MEALENCIYPEYVLHRQKNVKNDKNQINLLF